MTLQFQLEQTKFLKSMAHIRSVVSRRSPVPMLNNALLKVEADNLTLVATDMELALSETITVTDGSEGATTVPALLLYEIISKLPSGSNVAVKLTENDTQLLIIAEHAEFSLRTIDPQEFPKVGINEELTARFNLTAKVLQDMLGSISFCMAQDEARQYLNGAYLHTVMQDKQNCLRLVATDGHRLGQYQYIIDKETTPLPEIVGIIIPRKMIDELRKLLEEVDPTATVELGYSDQKFHAGCDNWQVESRLVAGKYPDYQRVIPAQHNKVLQTNRKQLLEAVDRVLTVADQTHMIKFQAEDKELTVSAWTMEGSQGKDKVKIEFSGSYNIGFNGRFIREISSQLHDEQITILICNEPDPVVIRGEKQDNCIYVLMPLRM